MQTVQAKRIDVSRNLPVNDVNITFAFGKESGRVYVTIDGGGEPIQHFAVPFDEFENVVGAWQDGEDDTDYDADVSPAVRLIRELHGDGRITSEDKSRLLAAL